MQSIVTAASMQGLMETALKDVPLGKKTVYADSYDPSLLFPIPRKDKRAQIGIGDGKDVFSGLDIWNAFELSWLNAKGKPEAAEGTFLVPANSDFLVESKSFKLYLNSFNNTQFEDWGAVSEALTKDLSQAIGADVRVSLQTLEDAPIEGRCLDLLDIACDTYTVDSSLLSLGNEHVEKETVYSHLLRSYCLVTGQPDWGSVWIQYTGQLIEEESLLRYIVSYRNHQGFAEHCVEEIFMDIMRMCRPEKLTVYGRYTRRGGLDINPFRSTETSPDEPLNIPWARQ